MSFGRYHDDDESFTKFKFFFCLLLGIGSLIVFVLILVNSPKSCSLQCDPSFNSTPGNPTNPTNQTNFNNTGNTYPNTGSGTTIEQENQRRCNACIEDQRDAKNRRKLFSGINLGMGILGRLLVYGTVIKFYLPGRVFEHSLTTQVVHNYGHGYVGTGDTDPKSVQMLMAYVLIFGDFLFAGMMYIWVQLIHTFEVGSLGTVSGFSSFSNAVQFLYIMTFMFNYTSPEVVNIAALKKKIKNLATQLATEQARTRNLSNSNSNPNRQGSYGGIPYNAYANRPAAQSQNRNEKKGTGESVTVVLGSSSNDGNSSDDGGDDNYVGERVANPSNVSSNLDEVRVHPV